MVETTGKRRKSVWLAVLILLSLGAFFAFRIYQTRDSRNGGAPDTVSADASGQRPGQNGGRPQGQGAFGGSMVGRNRPTLVDVATASRGKVQDQLSLVGSLKAKEQVEVMPMIAGRLERMHVDVGDPVTEGQLIAELEGEELTQQVLRAEATLAVAEATSAQRQAELENAQAEDKRAAELLAQGLISLQGKEMAETRTRVVESQLALAKAQVRQAEAELEELRIRRRQTQIHSPLTGWVGRRYVHPGAMVNSNTGLVSVLRLSPVVAEVSVPEKDLARLQVGNRAKVSVDALGGRSFAGRVARISPLLDPTTRSGSAEIEIQNLDGQLKAEMFARIAMEMGGERTVLLIPREAIVIRGQQPGVNVLTANRVQFHPLETGASTPQGVEILAGLDEGTTVITRGTQALKDGDTVSPTGTGEHAPAEDRS